MPPRKSKSDKPPRRRGTRPARRETRERRERLYKAVVDPGADAHETLSPPDLYRLEKQRRAAERPANHENMLAAEREYRAQLEADAARGKGGRPRKNAARPKPTDNGEFDSGRDMGSDEEVENADDA